MIEPRTTCELVAKTNQSQMHGEEPYIQPLCGEGVGGGSELHDNRLKITGKVEGGLIMSASISLILQLKTESTRENVQC